MDALRRSRTLIRLVTAVAFLWTAAMLIAPALAQPGVELVCSGGFVKAVQHDGGGADQHLGHWSQCPVCALAAAPPADPGQAALPSPERGFDTRGAFVRPWRPEPAAAPPARGPPRFS